MVHSCFKIFITLLIVHFSHLSYSQESISSKDLVNHLYKHHSISFELKNNEKKGHVFVDFLSDENYQYEIALIDRIPINKIDSEDILKITVSDSSDNTQVYQNTFDKGINDIQDYDKKIISEFSKVLLTHKSIRLKPIFSYNELKSRVMVLQNENALVEPSKKQ